VSNSHDALQELTKRLAGEQLPLTAATSRRARLARQPPHARSGVLHAQPAAGSLQVLLVGDSAPCQWRTDAADAAARLGGAPAKAATVRAASVWSNDRRALKS
jgi:hypothetical protein